MRVILSSDKTIDSARSLFVGNLPFRTTEQAFLELFKEKFGEVESVRIVHDKATGLGKGYGFVTFKSADVIQKALKDLQALRYKGRPLRFKKMSKKKNVSCF